MNRPFAITKREILRMILERRGQMKIVVEKDATGRLTTQLPTDPLLLRPMLTGRILPASHGKDRVFHHFRFEIEAIRKRWLVRAIDQRNRVLTDNVWHMRNLGRQKPHAEIVFQER
ncbi:MAG: hypothetical protein CM1200mP2_56260 [Planctomycetaceae bacterium]|nr:MAG: hypothetical protein CM1200mP2_56260 [Planctomycetaceae bacterium]